jgi:hypothetical protein
MVFGRKRSTLAPDPTLDPGRAAYAGAVAAIAYLLAMYADMAITRSPSDDLLMLGRPFTVNRCRARIIGLPLHVGFGAFVGLIYAGYGHCRLRGPNWLRGATMMAIENTVLWPTAIVADRAHPSMVSGELPKLNTAVPFAQQLVRHAAFGLVLGVLYGDGRTTPG